MHLRVGMKKQKETFLFFHVNDAATFKSVLKNNLCVCVCVRIAILV